MSNSEIDLLTRSLSGNIRTIIRKNVPEGLVGRGKALEFSTETDHWYAERRTLRLVLKRAKGKWLANPDRIEHIKRSIKEASNKINSEIKKADSDRLEVKIKNINNNNNRFRTIKSLRSGTNTSYGEARVKDSAGNEIKDFKDRANHLAEFYA